MYIGNSEALLETNSVVSKQSFENIIRRLEQIFPKHYFLECSVIRMGMLCEHTKVDGVSKSHYASNPILLFPNYAF